MANPFLVLGGIAISVATAAFGILQVPGWVASAQDASAINDLTSIKQLQAVSASQGNGYLTGGELAFAEDSLGASFTVGSTEVCITRSDAGDAYAAVAVSSSGKYFAQTHDHAEPVAGASPEAALAAAGGLPAGVQAPSGGNCLTGDPASTTTSMGQVAKVVHTTHGTYAIDRGGKLTRSGTDGLPHEVTFTGPLLNTELDPLSLGRDARGNLYLSGEFQPSSGGPKQIVAKLAHDFTSTIVAEAPAGSRFVVGSSPDGNVVFYRHDGTPGTATMWKLVEGVAVSVPMSSQPAVNVNFVSGDVLGFVYYGDRNNPGHTYQIQHSGVVWDSNWTRGGFNYKIPGGMLVGGPEHHVYGEADPTSPYGRGVIVEITLGSIIPILDLNTMFGADASKYSLAFTDSDMSGNLYGTITDSTGGAGKETSHVFKLTPGEDIQILMENAGDRLL